MDDKDKQKHVVFGSELPAELFEVFVGIQEKLKSDVEIKPDFQINNAEAKSETPNTSSSSHEKESIKLSKGKQLARDKHPQLELFVPDILTWSPKTDRHSLEHPFFTLSKKKDTKIREYVNGDVTITITPSVIGLATIYDKDILIYAASVIRNAINQGLHDFEQNVPVNITAYNMLVTTNRSTGGNDYKLLEAALERLAGTRIKTNIPTGEVRQRQGFGLIESWRITTKTKSNRMEKVEIKLSDWLFNAIKNQKEMLTISRDYFRLMGGIERRIYEIARKFCGRQPNWKCSMEILFKRSGSVGGIDKFRFAVKAIAESNHLPDYLLEYNKQDDSVLFHSKSSKKLLKSLQIKLGT